MEIVSDCCIEWIRLHIVSIINLSQQREKMHLNELLGESNQHELLVSTAVNDCMELGIGAVCACVLASSS